MIRCAVAKDIPAIMEMSREFYNTTDYAKFAPFDEGTVLDLVESVVFHGIFVVGTDNNDVPVGILGFVLTPFIFNRNILSCVEAIWYVKEDFRKSTMGIGMIRYADKLRKLRGAKHFQLARLNTSPECLDKILEKLGFNFSEKYFSKVD